jgi:predicted peptidase
MIFVIINLITSCNIEKNTTSEKKLRRIYTPAETFTDEDKPETKSLDSFKLDTPWGYNKESNTSRNYPIVVNGCWGEGVYFPDEIRKKYPSFYLDFNNYYTESDGELLSKLIDDAISEKYRLDMDRIYLTGFSQGGSGSFKLVRGMLNKGKLFAAIIRVAGQSESVLADAAVAKTSLWYHIGLDDEPARIDVAMETYSNLKKHQHYKDAFESISTDTITGYNRTTKTFTKDGVEIFKFSVYTGVGHTPAPCYNDSEIFDWLFNNSLSFR